MAVKPTYEELEQRVQELESILKNVDNDKSDPLSLSIVQDLPVLICTYLKNGEITFVNKAYCNYFNKNCDELIGSNFLSLIPENDRETVIQNILDLTPQSPSQTHEHRVISPDGTIHWQKWTNVAIFSEQGEAVHFKSIGQDITEQKYNALAVEKFFEQPMNSHLIVNFDGVIHRCNKGFLNTLGYTNSDVEGEIFFDFLHPNDLNDTAKEMENLEKGNTTFYFENRYRHRKGEYRLLAWSAVASVEDGLIYAVAKDITERKQAEKTLRENENKFRQLFDNSPIGKSITYISGEIHANEAFSRMLGYSKDEFQNIKWQEITHPDDIALSQKAVDSMLSGNNDSDRFLKKYIHKNGSVIWGDVSSKLQRDGEGNPHYFITAVNDITKRKMAEEALQESEGRLRSLINALPDLVWLKDQNGVYLSCNLKFERFFGETETNIKGKTDYDFVGKELADFFRKNDQVAMDAGKPVINEEEVVYADDGHKEILETIKTPIYDSQHRLKGVLGIGRDITVRKNTEIALKENRNQLDSILSNIQGLTYRCRLDRDWTMIYLSDWASQLTGYPSDDFINNKVRTFGSLIHADDSDRIYQTVIKAVAEHEPWELEYRINHKSHGTFWVYEKGSAVYDSDGNVEYLDGFVINISEQKKIQQSLEISQKRFQKVFNSHIDAIFILSETIPPEIIDCNSAALTIFQYEKNELFGKTTDKLHIDPSHLKEFQSALYTAIDKGKTLRDYQFKMKRKDGTVFPSEHAVLELKNDDGDRTGWVSIVKDMTEKQKTEAQFRQIQKMESIGNLAGGIAHDFNNILFPIIGMSELLLEDLPTGSPERENAEEILMAGKRGGELVKQILAFSRQSEHKKTPTRIQNILKEVLRLTRSSIPTYIEINKDIQQDCGIIMADSTRIHQVCLNIITNAYHALEKKGGKIKVILKEKFIDSMESSELNILSSHYAVLSISDNGHGISEDLISKIFDPYFTTKERGKGTGLGLSVVYGIVKEHKGSIKVNSEIGKGTRFDIYLPLMKKRAKYESRDEPEELTGGNEHIMLVDDERPIINLGRQMLERMGYKVTPRLNSFDALETFKSNPGAYDLIITDMSMPNITGDNLAVEIRSIRPDIPIIICTGFSEIIDEEKAKAIGINGFLMKPLVKSKLIKMVRNILDRPGQVG